MPCLQEKTGHKCPFSGYGQHGLFHLRSRGRLAAMGEDMEEVGPEEVAQSLDFALLKKGPKAARIKDNAERAAMTKAVIDHLALCGVRFYKKRRGLAATSVLRGPEKDGFKP